MSVQGYEAPPDTTTSPSTNSIAPDYFRTMGIPLIAGREFTRGDAAEAPKVLAIEDTEWHGPFISVRGAHFLRVAERYAARLPEYQALASWVETEWALAKSREMMDVEMEEVSKGYRVEVLQPGEEVE